MVIKSLGAVLVLSLGRHRESEEWGGGDSGVKAAVLK